MKIYPIHLRGLLLGLSLLVFGGVCIYIGVSGGLFAFAGFFGLLALLGLFLTVGLLADIRHDKEYYERNENVFGVSMATQTMVASFVFGVITFTIVFTSGGHPARLPAQSAVTIGYAVFLYVIALCSIAYSGYIAAFGLPESAIDE